MNRKSHVGLMHQQLSAMTGHMNVLDQICSDIDFEKVFRHDINEQERTGEDFLDWLREIENTCRRMRDRLENNKMDAYHDIP